MLIRKLSLPILVVIVSGVGAALLACFAAAHVNNAYYNLHPFNGDTSSFYSVQISLYFQSLAESKTQAILQQLLANTKNPLAYVHYLMLPRSYLLKLNSHLIFTAAALAVFSALLGFTIFKRTGSILYGAIAPYLLFCAEGLFNPIYELPSKLSDPPAALIFGCAIFCILNSDEGRRLGWLAAFGAFAALTLFNRFTASGYLFFVCAPVLALYFVRRWRDAGLGPLHVARAVAAIAIPLLAIAGWYFFTNVRGVLSFYSVAGYALGQGFAASVELTLLKFIDLFLGGMGIGVPLFVAGIYTMLFWRWRRLPDDIGVTVWMAISVPLLLVGILRVEDDYTQLIYAVPGLIVFALTPFSLAVLPKPECKQLTQFAAAFAVALVPISLHAMWARPYSAYVYNLDPHDFALLLTDRKMTEYAATRQREQLRDQFIDASFDYHWRHLQPTALQSYGSLLRTHRQFEIRKEQWWLRFGDKTEEQLIKMIANEYNSWADILYLLAEPKSERGMIVVKDDFTATVAVGLLEWVRNAPGWSELGKVDTPYGVVEVWANDNRK